MLRWVVGLLALTALLSGCGDDDDAPSRSAFEGAVADQYDATDEQAGCIADYAYADYDDGALVVLADEGVAALPQALWEPFVTAVIACTVDPDELAP